MKEIYVLVIWNHPVAWSEHRAPLIEYAEKQTPKFNEQICTALGITPISGYEAIKAN